MPPKKKSSITSSEAPKRTKLKDLSEYLGLSQTTISFVLNNAPQVKDLSEETRQRVKEAARKLNYRPSYFALNLNKGRSESIGVIAPEHSEGYFTMVMGGVERYLIQQNFMYFTACHYWKPKLMKEYPKLLEKRGAEGLLLLNTNADFESPLPVVALSAHLEREGVTNVVIDHVHAARLALKHLYDSGHRKIAFMKGHRHIIDTGPRWDAMMTVAREYGLQPTAERTTEMNSGSWSPQVGYEPTKRLLDATHDFTALMCFNDTAAIGAIRALHDAGLSVPGDVSVVGFDDIASAEFNVPSLTTIRQPLPAMGKQAAQILLERISRPDAKFPPTVFVPPKLVVRESTGRARKR